MAGGFESFYQRARNAVDEGLVRFGVRRPDLSERPEFMDRVEGLDTVHLDDVDVDRSQLSRYLGAVEEEEALSVAGHSRYLDDDPRLFNEAIAVHESLNTYEELGVIDDAEGLSEQIFSEVVNDRGLAQGLVDSELVESNESYESVRFDQIPGIYMDNIVSDIEGGDGTPFRFTYEEGEWRPVEGGVEGVEVIRKSDNLSIGGKTPTSHPGEMYRLRNVEFVDGEPVSTWREDPTEYTSEVRESAESVIGQYSEEFPGVELSLFGSPENGTMKPGSDIEHGLHVPLEHVGGVDSIEEVEDSYSEVKRGLDDFRKEIVGEVVDEASVDISQDAYGYVSIRGEGQDYALGRNEYDHEDSRLIVDGEGMQFVNYDEHLEQQGLEETGDIQSSGLFPGLNS